MRKTLARNTRRKQHHTRKRSHALRKTSKLQSRSINCEKARALSRTCCAWLSRRMSFGAIGVFACAFGLDSSAGFFEEEKNVCVCVCMHSLHVHICTYVCLRCARSGGGQKQPTTCNCALAGAVFFVRSRVKIIRGCECDK